MSDLGSHVRRAQINLCENTFYKPEPLAKNKNGLPYAYFSLKLRTNYNLCLLNSPTAWKVLFFIFLSICLLYLGPQGGTNMSNLLHSNCIPLISKGPKSSSSPHTQMQSDIEAGFSSSLQGRWRKEMGIFLNVCLPQSLTNKNNVFFI